MDINWTEVYGDAVRPPLDWTPPADGRCELERWHTANCPPFEEMTLEIEGTPGL